MGGRVRIFARACCLLVGLSALPASGLSQEYTWDTSPDPGFQGGRGAWSGRNWRSPSSEDFQSGTPRLNPVFQTDAEVTIEGEVAPGESEGIARITVRKGSVTLAGGTIRIGTVLEIVVDEGATLTIRSGLTGGRDCPADLPYDNQQAWTLPAMKCSGLYKTGGGRLVLGGASSYRGLTIVAGGILEARTRASVPGKLIGVNRGVI
ncbi:MAG: autotransporter-associated beta strand repeat-containing protein, partial [Planctomycetota bacterium]